ncbi:MAG: methyltransferase domain-containing protein [Pyrinomonadaceae bacterium]|nr:methyltransferase domain-containing protein [Pyrinomonadaceae bacterium]
MSSPGLQQPTPQLFFQTVNAYQRTEGLKAAIELEVFTAIGEGKTTADEIAERSSASERGMRILCDFLCVLGFLTKNGRSYELTPESALFLDKRSPAYLGGSLEFLLSPMLTDGFKDLTGAVRKGGTVASEEGTIAPEHPIWVMFARAMTAMTAMPAQLMANLVDEKADGKLKVLDIAAGHGLYGIAFASKNPRAEIVAVDWPNVLELARENAVKAGVADRYQTNAGNAFDVDYGSGYDLVLLTNFLHHFDPVTCETLLRKVHAALADDGRAVILEFVPNEDRISPPETAPFSVVMLASTPAGDAYTFPELDRMCGAAGFARSEIHQLPPSIQQVVISHKRESS